MFVNTATARRIERAEAETTRAMAEGVIAAGRAPGAFALAISEGVAAYLRPGSPMNKIIGAGLDTALDAEALARVEEALRARDEPARVELATLAAAGSAAALTARGYQLLGFENVLARPLAAPPPAAAPGLRIERMTAASTEAWKRTIIDAFASGDETGVPVDRFSLDAITATVEDDLTVPAFDRYLAFTDGVPAGAAVMHVHDGVALFTGAGTLPAWRRRGVQGGLIAARLQDARARGAELAVVVTAPGSQSQANAMKHGFSLVYARAILTRSWSA